MSEVVSPPLNDAESRAGCDTTNRSSGRRDIVLQIVRLADATVAEIAGPLDHRTAADIETTLLRAIVAGQRLVIDAAGLTYLGAAGARLLVAAVARAHKLAVPVTICGLGKFGKECLHVGGFGDLIDLCADRQEAFRRIGAQPSAR